MFSVRISVNQSNINGLIQRLKSLVDKKAVALIMASSVAADMAVRVHKEGKDSSNNGIGTYSEGYMKVRTGNFGNSKKVSRGANKGKLKDGGTISRGVNKGKPREKYNRTADRKVVLSLTRQMENDMGIMPTPNGYGIGYKNNFNFDKSQWAEKKYNKKIFSISDNEEKKMLKTVNEYLNALS